MMNSQEPQHNKENPDDSASRYAITNDSNDLSNFWRDAMDAKATL
ncbi:hypothetical protein GCM10009133_14480 [Cocleimonas flava]